MTFPPPGLKSLWSERNGGLLDVKARRRTDERKRMEDAVLRLSEATVLREDGDGERLRCSREDDIVDHDLEGV